MKWYDYMKHNGGINYIFLKEKENCRLKVQIIYVERKNFNIQGYNGSEYVCVSWSGALVQRCYVWSRQEEVFIFNGA